MGMTLEERKKLAREKGFVFDSKMRAFITEKNKERLAMDAQLVTMPNGGIPATLTAYIDTEVIEILTAERNAREIYPEVKKGDWTNTHAQFKTIEHTGSSAPYTDFGRGKTSDVNANFPTREQYLFETTIRYGVRESEVLARALIDMASEKQVAAANTLDSDSNKFYLYGVEGLEIYGLLNEPNLPSSVPPSVVNGSTLFTDKNTQQIYNDVISLFAAVVKNSRGRVNERTPLVLGMAPETAVQLSKATDYNVSVMDMLNKYFSDLTPVMLPELSSDTAGNEILITARTIQGRTVGQFGYSEKMRALPLIQQPSWYEQKFAAGTYGCVLYYPFAVATMIGI